MSFLGRLLGRSAPASAPAAPPAGTVVIPEELAAELTADGRPLAEAVESALRDQLRARARAEGGKVPFWLARDDRARGQGPGAEEAPSAESGAAGLDIEDELRGRLERRRSAEGGGDG